MKDSDTEVVGGGGDLPPAVRLKVSGLCKTFGRAEVLRGVNLELRAGEIHGFIGRNGSGKSTLIKILSGFYEPDPGSVIEIDGRPLPARFDATTSASSGLAVVHQDLGLVPALSVLENLTVGRFRESGPSHVSWRRERRAAQLLLHEVGLELDLDAQVAALPTVERSMLAIARALGDMAQFGDGVLILDEPTAFLPHDSVERLFGAMRKLARAGTTVLFVSHRLDEVAAVTDRVSVLRDGVLVATMKSGEINEQQMIELMLGDTLHSFYPDKAELREAPAVLGVRELGGAGIGPVDLELHPGEILGITGVNGAGYERIPHLVFGAETARSGQIEASGTTVAGPKMTPRLAMSLGIGFLPADRRTESGAPSFSLTQNVSLPFLHRYWRHGRLNSRAEREDVLRLLREHGVTPADPRMLLAQLSGGNQQKALLAKWLESAPKVLLLQEPCQGVDVPAKRDIFARLSALAATGVAVLVASAEYEDLAALCHRVLVMRDGHVVDEFSGQALTAAALVNASYAHRSRQQI